MIPEYLHGFMTLFIIIPFIVLIVYLMKRYGTWTIKPSARLQLIEHMTLGPRHRILLIAVNKKTVLLGVASDNISLLHTFDDSAATDTHKENHHAIHPH